MNGLDEYFLQKKAMGLRFQRFRQLLGKSRKKLEEESNQPLVTEVRIKLVEIGAIIPDIMFIQYFTEEFGLDLTWLVTGAGKPFFKKGRKTRLHIYQAVMIHNMVNPLINRLIKLCGFAEEKTPPGPMQDDFWDIDAQHNQPGADSEEIAMVSILLNSIHYFIECVYILPEDDMFRLVAIHQGRVICDKHYKTLVGGRIAFNQIFRDKAWCENVKAIWSPVLSPVKYFLKKNRNPWNINQ